MKRNLSNEPAQENNPPGKVAHCCLMEQQHSIRRILHGRGAHQCVFQFLHASSALLYGASLTLLTLRTARSLITDAR